MNFLLDLLLQRHSDYCGEVHKSLTQFALPLFHLTVNAMFSIKCIQKYTGNLFILFLFIFKIIRKFFLKFLFFINNRKILLKNLISF